MAAKPETAAAPPKEAAAVAASATALVAPASAGAKLAAWLPALVALVGAPAATWATVEFGLLPHLRKKIAAQPPITALAPAAPAPAVAKRGGKPGTRDGHDAAPSSFEFQNIVVNLAGTMGTRYLKTSFLVTGAPGTDIKQAFDGAKPRMTDVTLNVLSSLSLADLEEPGSKNLIREKLVSAYNQALGKKVADQVYFSDFVIQ